MSNRVSIHLHHNGEFTPNLSNGNAGYVGGVVEIIDNVDTDTLSFFDFEDYALKYDFSKDDLLYFITDGRNFNGGVRLLYDDESDIEGDIEEDIEGDIEGDIEEDIGEDIEGDIESEDSEDPNYEAEFNSDSESDEELVAARKARKLKGIDSEESEFSEGDYNSDELRTEESSSDDENLKKGYVGIPPGQL
ncbi:hypothetical protein POM88_045292 [Heracleum sosnowskyi]|uniref:PB1-like domain-containing protein n=1 Tax=Heracleum sosnowskyi TaxID=360622 RepID=A0AAD8H666_9APIA|nr:hypothetical protein POM88_045292 [Heracleum sosnowskyi]